MRAVIGGQFDCENLSSDAFWQQCEGWVRMHSYLFFVFVEAGQIYEISKAVRSDGGIGEFEDSSIGSFIREEEELALVRKLRNS